MRRPTVAENGFGSASSPSTASPPPRGRSTPTGVVEHVDRGDLPLGIRPEPKSISDGHGSREHANVRDLLAGPPALDLEDAAGDRAVDVPFAGRQKLRDACHQRIDARAGDRRAEE